MSPDLSTSNPDIFTLVLFVAVLWIVAWLITRRREKDSSRGRWLRFGVYGIFWLILISAMLLREWQRAEERSEYYREVMKLQDTLDKERLRRMAVEQQLRDEVEMLERQLKSRPSSPSPSTAVPSR